MHSTYAECGAINCSHFKLVPATLSRTANERFGSAIEWQIAFIFNFIGAIYVIFNSMLEHTSGGP